MISKKRYWGLALPIYDCAELRHVRGHRQRGGAARSAPSRAGSEFEGHSPHRPWVDAVKIACAQCGAAGRAASRMSATRGSTPASSPSRRCNYRARSRVLAQVVPGRLHHRELSRASSATGSTRCWPEHRPDRRARLPQRLLRYALLRDEHGEEMHKSKGNAIWFEDAAEQMGVDTMRWLFCAVQPEPNLNFGYQRRATRSAAASSCRSGTRTRSSPPTPRLDGFDPSDPATPCPRRRAPAARPLDHLATATSVIADGARRAGRLRRRRRPRNEIEQLRRRRTLELVHPPQSPPLLEERERRRQGGRLPHALRGLTTVARLLAPFIPFLAESMYQNLVRSLDPDRAGVRAPHRLPGR